MDALRRNGWALVVRGIAAVLFGLWALFWPSLTVAALVVVFGAFAFVSGLFALFGAVRAGAGNERWAALVLEGITGIAAGVLAWAEPTFTALAMLVLIAGWAVITGALELVAAFRLRELVEGEWLLGLAGGLSIALGVVMLAWPRAAALAIVWVLGAYAIAFGATLIALGFRMRRLNRELRV